MKVRPREVIAVVGDGGEARLAFRLAAELATAGMRVVTTASARFATHEAAAPLEWLVQPDACRLLAELPRTLGRSRHVLAVAELDQRQGGALGLPPTVIEQVAALPEVDILIVAVSRSRGLPADRLAARDPGIPRCASLVVPFAGLDTVGQSCEPVNGYWLELASGLARVAACAPAAARVAAAIVAGRRGDASPAPSMPRADVRARDALGAGARRTALNLAQMLLDRPRIERVVVGALAATEPVWLIWERARTGS